MLLLRLIPLLICFSALPATADTREWKSSDGARTIPGKFVKRDDKTITLQRPDGSEITFELTRLHVDDVRWLNQNHPAKAAATTKNAVFDQLVFGDTRDQVLAKLKASKAIEMTLDEKFISRVGFNGSFRTKNKIGGQAAMLYFGWCDKGTLNEISLQTDPAPSSKFDTNLKPCWSEMRDLLTNIHGPARVKGEPAELSKIAKDTMMASHVWDLKPEGSLLLGTAHEATGYLVVARFSQNKH